MSQYDNWIVEDKAPITRLSLNRPDTLNNLTTDTLHELRDISSSLSSRDDIWVVILEGKGDHFSSGMDLRLITERLDSPQNELVEFIRDQQRCLDAFESLDKVLIAKIHGFCIGGGLILALCCDFRIAGKRTIFSLPEIKLGFPIMWGTQRVVRTVGVPLAKEIILRGKKYRGEEALRMGLVNQLVEGDLLEKEVTALAEQFTRLPPRTVWAARRIINSSLELTQAESLEMEIDELGGLVGSSDVKEAINSYMNKRRPVFRGK